MWSSPCKVGLRPAPLAVAAIFLLTAIALSNLLPLWLDEIIQLRETRNTTPAQLIASLPKQPGAAPLGYLIQQTALRITGYSVRRARLPSAIFIAGTVLIVAFIGAQLGLSKPWLGAALFALFPLTLRYACESRIYSQALFFSTLATLLFLRLAQKPTILRTAAYCLALTAAIYTQPYAIFVAFAHITWAKRKLKPIAGVTLAIAAFAPWYVAARTIWSSGIAGAQLHFVLSAKTPLMLFREVAGAGYWGSGLLLILCALAKANRFLLLLIAVPVILALTADGLFGYFVATRQILWILPAIALLAAFAIDRKPRIALPIAILLAAVCIWQSIHYFTSPRENWQIAADALALETKKGGCLIVVPPQQQPSYEFFRPELSQAQCPAARTVVAFTPYATKEQRDTAASALIAQGYTRQQATEAGKTQIELYTR